MKAKIRRAIDNAQTDHSRHATRINLYRAGENTSLETPPIPNSETPAQGRQRCALNAFQHGLSGNRMILQEHELEAYRRINTELYSDYKPANESERQLVQKIIDCHTRLNRVFAIENNILNIGIANTTNPDSTNDDVTETMVAQATVWAREADSFEKLGRFESRISRQLIQYSKELDRIQTARHKHEADLASLRQPQQNKTDDSKYPSFRQTPAPRPMTAPHTAIPADNTLVFASDSPDTPSATGTTPAIVDRINQSTKAALTGDRPF